MTSDCLQVFQSRDLHQQLKNALESNANLSRLFTRLNLQLGDILGEDSTGEALESTFAEGPADYVSIRSQHHIALPGGSAYHIVRHHINQPRPLASS